MDTEFNDRANCPINLSLKEISDPFIVISSFFSVDNVPGHLWDLQKWRDRVIGNGFYTDVKGNPSGLLFTHQLNVKLIEAAMVLQKPVFSEILMQCATYHLSQIDSERESFTYFPDNLNESELLNPYFVIRNVLNRYSLAEYRAHLYDWLTYALSIKPSNEFVESSDLIAVYENLQKLYSALWLIHQRLRSSTQSPKAHDESDAVNSHVRVFDLEFALEERDQSRLGNIVSTIKHKLTSTCGIIFLGRATDDDSSIFLLVLTSDSEQREALSLGTMLEESCRPAKIIALVHYASSALNAMQSGDRFFSRTFGCPALYLSGDIFLPNPHSISRNFELDLSEANWERWLKQGKEFLIGAEYYLSAKATSAALFSLHQCAECILVAIIRAVLGYRINSHNLLRLLRVTQMFTNDLVDVFRLDTKAGKKNFDVLKEAYISIRYRDTYEPDTKTVDTLYPVVSNLLSIAEQVHKQFLLTAII